MAVAFALRMPYLSQLRYLQSSQHMAMDTHNLTYLPW